MLPTDLVSTVPKPILLATYGIVAASLCLMPVLAAAARLSSKGAWLSARFRRALLYALFVALFVGCFWFGHGADGVNFSILVLIAAVLLSIVKGRFDRLVFVVTFTTLFVSRMLIWWRQSVGPFTISAWEIAQIALLLAIVSAVLNEFAPFGPRLNQTDRRTVRLRGVLVLLFLLLAAVMSCARSLQASTGNAYTAWHHWSVYVAPIKLLQAGAVPLKDFAIQYGLGPTLLIDLLAPADPWTVMPTLTSVQLVLETALVAAIVWIIVEPKRSVLYFTVALIGCGGACLTWVAWPPELAIPTLVPSVSGMRYTPVLIQTFFILAIGERIKLFRFQLAGHLIWVLASLWAPELLFYATAIWGPYYLWQKSTASGKFQARLAIWALVVLALVVVIATTAFLSVFWYLFGTVPTWYGYIAYVVNEPDPINLAVRGVVWTLVTVLILIGLALFEALRTKPRDAATRNLFVTLCLTLATLSIFIGRSHENNFLVVLPFMMLTVLCAASSSQQVWLKRALYAFFACSIAYMPVFNWQPWVKFIHTANDQGMAAALDSKPLLDELSYMTAAGQKVLEGHRPERLVGRVEPSDAKRAIEAITSQYREPITMYDINFVMLNGPASRGWNGIQDPAAFLPLSPKKRLDFIAATAQRLNQPGWFVVNRLWIEGWSPNRGLLNEMDTAYDEDKQLEFGTYYAIRFVPKTLAKSPSDISLPQPK